MAFLKKGIGPTKKNEKKQKNKKTKINKNKNKTNCFWEQNWNRCIKIKNFGGTLEFCFTNLETVLQKYVPNKLFIFHGFCGTFPFMWISNPFSYFLTWWIDLSFLVYWFFSTQNHERDLAILLWQAIIERLFFK